MTQIFTIVTRSHLAEARVLMRSVAEYWPEASRTVFVTDLLENDTLAPEADFEIIRAQETPVPRFKHLAFAYTASEFCYVLKPFCARYLFNREDVDAVVYFDGDMLLLSAPEDLKRTLRKHSVVLTPHRLTAFPGEQMHHNLVTSGTFNAGFFAVSHTEEGQSFLEWWGNQLIVPANISIQWHNDQGWLDFVPVFFPNAHVLRHPGYNVAFWNLEERTLEFGEHSLEGCNVSDTDKFGAIYRVRFGGEEFPLVLYHFSLFDAGYPEALTGNLESGVQRPNEALKELLRDYSENLWAAGLAEYRQLFYGYGSFMDGEPVTAGHRSYYKERFFRSADAGGDPFDPHSVLSGGKGLKSLRNYAHPLTRLLRRVKGILG